MLAQEITWEEREYDQLVRDVTQLEEDYSRRQSGDQKVSRADENRLANVQESLAHFDFMARHGDFGDESQRYLKLSSELRTRANKLMDGLR